MTIRRDTASLVVTALAAVVGVQLLALAVIKGITPSAFNQDVGWMLYGGQVLLDGGRYGTDVVDPNPPLIFWLSAVVVGLSRLFGVTPQLAFNLTVIGLVFTSVGLCHVAYSARAVSAPDAWLVTALFAIAMVVPAGRDFGQRDHLAAVLVMPYLLLVGMRLARRELPRSLQLTAGLLAGLGLALKPFFLLMWLVPEAYLALRIGWRRSWSRLETVTIGLTQVVYLGLIIVLAPGYVSNPTQLLGYQDAYASPIPFVNQATPYLALVLVLALVARPRAPWLGLRHILLLNVVVCMAIVLVQAKGFRYHYVPVYIASLSLANVVVLGSSTVDVLGRYTLRIPFRALAGTLVVLGVVATGIHTRNVLRYRNLAVEELQRTVQTLAPDGPIFLASPSIPPAFPLVNLAGVTWTSRYGNQWLVPASYTAEERASDPFVYRPPAQMVALERQWLDHLIEDMEMRPPALILLPTGPVWPMVGAFDWGEYLDRDPRFARLLRAYEHVGDVLGYRVYTATR